MIGVTEGMVYKYYKMDNVDSQTIEKWANILRIPIMTFLDDNTYERATHKATSGIHVLHRRSTRQEARSGCQNLRIRYRPSRTTAG